MQENAKKNLITKNFFNSDSICWFWPIWAGFLFGIGYSIPKNIYLSKIHSEKNFDHASKDFPDLKNSVSQKTQEKQILRNENQPMKNKILKKIIYLPTKKDSITRLEINYSQVQNLKNQAVFKNQRNFFAKETVRSLTRNLKNTKKTKSSRVEVD